MLTEGPDGYDTIEWLARQPKSDGNVGIFGTSYHGGATVLAASEAPPNLIGGFAQMSADQFKDEWVYLDGALVLATTVPWNCLMANDALVHVDATTRKLLQRDLDAVGLHGEALFPTVA
jgi:predicted acyl esterase